MNKEGDPRPISPGEIRRSTHENTQVVPQEQTSRSLILSVRNSETLLDPSHLATRFANAMVYLSGLIQWVEGEFTIPYREWEKEKFDGVQIGPHYPNEHHEARLYQEWAEGHSEEVVELFRQLIQGLDVMSRALDSTELGGIRGRSRPVIPRSYRKAAREHESSELNERPSQSRRE